TPPRPESVQPATLQDELVPASASTDTVPPSATITAPGNGTNVVIGSTVTVTGTASDVGGQLGGVAVSRDGGATGNPARGRATWSYTWVPSVPGPASLRARAADDSA